ncbi:hypothetical protein ATE84_4568 [Aquimarina sp. MAR_2010_214]|nr:hypothetical protein ATE84_4568 [Aquimarina sp. MAR_2010_214]
METKLKRNTYLSLLFFILVILTYLLRDFIDDNYYRKFLSWTTLFIFYPSILLSVFFSIKSFNLIYNNKELAQKNKWIILNSLSIIFALYFIVKIILVMSKPV